MKYARSDAKTYAHQHLCGIWAAAQTPFNADLSIDGGAVRPPLLELTEVEKGRHAAPSKAAG